MRLEYEGTGVSGGDGDEQGKLREDRKTGTGGCKGAEVSHGICFRFSIVSFSVFSIVSHLISACSVLYHDEAAGMRGEAGVG